MRQGSEAPTKIPVKHVRRGDRLVHGASGQGLGHEGGIVHCVVRTECVNGRAWLVALPGGMSDVSLSTGASSGNEESEREMLLVTPWHPVQIPGTASGAWTFPAHLSAPSEVPCEAVYSFLVTKDVMALQGQDENMTALFDKEQCVSSMMVSGVSCLTLAHGIVNDDVASHPFFGTYPRNTPSEYLNIYTLVAHRITIVN